MRTASVLITLIVVGIAEDPRVAGTGEKAG